MPSEGIAAAWARTEQQAQFRWSISLRIVEGPYAPLPLVMDEGTAEPPHKRGAPTANQPLSPHGESAELKTKVAEVGRHLDRAFGFHYDIQPFCAY